MKKLSSEVQDVDRCVKCGHNSSPEDYCEYEYPNGSHCGCKCEFPSTSVSEAEDQNSGEGRKEHRAVPCTESKATSELSAASAYGAFKTACRIHLNWTIGRYLMSHAEGRRDGLEKAERHVELCEFYVAVLRGHGDPSTVRRLYGDDFDALHDESKELTDNLDTAIGFPIHGMPEYNELEPLFFEKFHAIAMTTLANGQVTNTSASDGTT